MILRLGRIKKFRSKRLHHPQDHGRHHLVITRTRFLTKIVSTELNEHSGTTAQQSSLITLEAHTRVRFFSWAHVLFDLSC